MHTVFRPADERDLAHFLAHMRRDAPHLPIVTLGACSNVLISDDGPEGIVIRMGKEFAQIAHHSAGNMHIITAGAAVRNSQLSQFCISRGLSGLEFLSTIPGSIGGALAMNAGCYGVQTQDVMINMRAVDMEGCTYMLTRGDMGFSYRKCEAVERGLIFTSASFIVEQSTSEAVRAKVREMEEMRNKSQPLRQKTGGSTFKNPTDSPRKAWELIDEAGMRGYKLGGAMVSDKHCNFLINTGNATARDLLDLGEAVRAKVMEKTGVTLEWEIKRL